MTRTLASRLLAEAGRVDEAAFRLMKKFHNETPCGTFNGDSNDHWAECDGFADVMGYDSWEHWQAIRNAALGDPLPLMKYHEEKRA